MNNASSLRNTDRTELLPLDFSEVNAEWLTRTLQSQYPGVIVRSFKLAQFVQGHTTKARLELELNQAGIDAGIPRQVCLKANWSGSPLSSPVCVNEARFYKYLATKFPLPTPVSYFADWDDRPNRKQGLVVLEDLVVPGGSFGSSSRPIGIDEMSKSLEGLARLHGSSWGNAELDRQTWLQTAMAPETTTDDYWDLMKDYLPTLNKLPERLAVFPRWIAEGTDRLGDVFKQLFVHEMSNQGPRCLIHGDAHLGNSFRRPTGERVWLDWQIVRKGLPWRDVTYFIIGSMTIADRRKAERELLQHYLDHLATHGIRITLDKVWDEYRRMVVWGLVAWQGNINPNAETMPPLERFCRAAEDLETHQLFRM